MAGMRIEVATSEGRPDGLLFVPGGSPPFPLVVFFCDAGGLRPAMSDMAERLVANGYAVLQPNLYWRSGRYAPFDFATVWTDPAERQRLSALMNAFTPAQAMADTRALVDAAAADPRIAADSIGVMGYCMGGRMAFYAAAELSDRVVAAASIHGGGLVTPAPNSPHLGASRIEAALYIGVADNDQSSPPEAVRALEVALTEAGVEHQIELYPGAKHGFAVPDFPVYDEAAAERQWGRILALFRRAHLGTAG
jgi:carboxymethylenebutenolidase